jgi:hypothetical protein
VTFIEILLIESKLTLEVTCESDTDACHGAMARLQESVDRRLRDSQPIQRTRIPNTPANLDGKIWEI